MNDLESYLRVSGVAVAVTGHAILIQNTQRHLEAQNVTRRVSRQTHLPMERWLWCQCGLFWVCKYELRVILCGVWLFKTIKPRIQMVKLSILTVIRIAPTYTNRVLVRESILSWSWLKRVQDFRYNARDTRDRTRRGITCDLYNWYEMILSA